MVDYATDFSVSGAAFPSIYYIGIPIVPGFAVYRGESACQFACLVFPLFFFLFALFRQGGKFAFPYGAVHKYLVHRRGDGEKPSVRADDVASYRCQFYLAASGCVIFQIRVAVAEAALDVDDPYQHDTCAHDECKIDEPHYLAFLVLASYVLVLVHVMFNLFFCIYPCGRFCREGYLGTLVFQHLVGFRYPSHAGHLHGLFRMVYLQVRQDFLVLLDLAHGVFHHDVQEDSYPEQQERVQNVGEESVTSQSHQQFPSEECIERIFY